MVKAAVEDAVSLSLPVGMMLSIPGVTQVQYDYKGLRDGPELRTFQIAGRVEGEPAQARLRLRLDGDVEGDRNLYLEYTVNFQKSRSPFPAWSPFLDAPGDLRPSAVRAPRAARQRPRARRRPARAAAARAGISG